MVNYAFVVVANQIDMVKHMWANIGILFITVLVKHKCFAHETNKRTYDHQTWTHTPCQKTGSREILRLNPLYLRLLWSPADSALNSQLILFGGMAISQLGGA